MSRRAFADTTQAWRQLSRSLDDLAVELPPYLEEQRAVLDAALQEAVRLKHRHVRLRTQAIEAARKLQDTIAEGQEAESRLRAALKSFYGSKSESLRRHGIRPQRRGRGKPTHIVETPEEEPGEE